MTNTRFEILVSRWLENDLNSSELSELERLVHEHPDYLKELQEQLETADMLAQSQDLLRDSTRFVASTRSRLVEDQFIEGVRSRIVHKSGRSHLGKKQLSGWMTRWYSALAAAAILFVTVTLYLLAGQSDTESVRIVHLRGAVQWAGEGGQITRDIGPGRHLPGGTLEGLAEDSWVELEFDDRTRVSLTGQSMLMLSQQQPKQLYLRKGRLSASVQPQPTDKAMLIHTPTARIEVLGTQLNIEAEATTTTMDVNEGLVRVTRLSDGKVTEVPADHRLVTAVARDERFRPQYRYSSVSLWKSSMVDDVQYGKMVYEKPRSNGIGLIAASIGQALTGGGRELFGMSLRAMPILINVSVPTTLYLASLDVAPRILTPVLIQPGSRIQIRGAVESESSLHFGITLFYPQKGFAGKYETVRSVEGNFVLDIPVEELEPGSEMFPLPVDNLEFRGCWTFTRDSDAGLRLFSVELRSAALDN